MSEWIFRVELNIVLSIIKLILDNRDYLYNVKCIHFKGEEYLWKICVFEK